MPKDSHEHQESTIDSLSERFSTLAQELAKTGRVESLASAELEFKRGGVRLDRTIITEDEVTIADYATFDMGGPTNFAVIRFHEETPTALGRGSFYGASDKGVSFERDLMVFPDFEENDEKYDEKWEKYETAHEAARDNPDSPDVIHGQVGEAHAQGLLQMIPEITQADPEAAEAAFAKIMAVELDPECDFTAGGSVSKETAAALRTVLDTILDKQPQEGQAQVQCMLPDGKIAIIDYADGSFRIDRVTRHEDQKTATYLTFILEPGKSPDSSEMVGPYLKEEIEELIFPLYQTIITIANIKGINVAEPRQPEEILGELITVMQALKAEIPDDNHQPTETA